jgi:hypothetical protein
MIRICVVGHDADKVCRVLKDYGFEISSIEDCHIVVADAPVPDVKVPVLLYSKQEQLETAIAEIAKQFKPLYDSLNECLSLCKPKE